MQNKTLSIQMTPDTSFGPIFTFHMAQETSYNVFLDMSQVPFDLISPYENISKEIVNKIYK